MKLTETTIQNLIAKGASRWTKGDRNRLYLNGAAKKIVGLETEHYNSGNIRSATLKGEKISNSRATQILDNIFSAYIDLTTGNLYGRARSNSMDLLRAALDDLIEKEKAQGGTPELDSAGAANPRQKEGETMENNYYKKLESKNGNTYHDGIEYILTQMPYADGYRDGAGNFYPNQLTYYALAIRADAVPDSDGYVPLYQLMWIPTNPEAEDDADACDWLSADSARDGMGDYHVISGNIV